MRPSCDAELRASAATAPRSSGSMVATGTPANGARTVSPACSCGSHWKVLDMKLFGCRNVQGSPESRTARSERMW